MRKKHLASSLPDFIESLHSEAEQFKTYWQWQNAANPEGFPWLMRFGEWSEQFLSWVNTGKDGQQ
jgi:hypothetical protein